MKVLIAEVFFHTLFWFGSKINDFSPFVERLCWRPRVFSSRSQSRFFPPIGIVSSLFAPILRCRMNFFRRRGGNFLSRNFSLNFWKFLVRFISLNFLLGWNWASLGGIFQTNSKIDLGRLLRPGGSSVARVSSLWGSELGRLSFAFASLIELVLVVKVSSLRVEKTGKEIGLWFLLSGKRAEESFISFSSVTKDSFDFPVDRKSFEILEDFASLLKTSFCKGRPWTTTAREEEEEQPFFPFLFIPEGGKGIDSERQFFPSGYKNIREKPSRGETEEGRWAKVLCKAHEGRRCLEGPSAEQRRKRR